MTRIASLTVLLICALSLGVQGQMINSKGETVLNAKVVGSDTIPLVFLNPVTIMDTYMPGLSKGQLQRYKRSLRKSRRRYSKLRRNVYKTYPYAVMAGYVIHDIDSALLTLRSKEAKEIYKKRKEKELTKEFKGKLEKLTMSQGKVLVILIARETGKPCYSIIKDLKGGFNARIWQTLASLFANNLKRNYDPKGKDAQIEMICREIEASGKYVRKNN